jgi:hypothetical protein
VNEAVCAFLRHTTHRGARREVKGGLAGNRTVIHTTAGYEYSRARVVPAAALQWVRRCDAAPRAVAGAACFRRVPSLFTKASLGAPRGIGGGMCLRHCACWFLPAAHWVSERQSVLDVNLLAQGRSPHIAVSDPVIRKDDAFIAYSIDWMCVRSTAALGRSVAARSRAVARQGQRYSRRCRTGPAKWKRGALLMCCGATFGFPRSRVVATVF